MQAPKARHWAATELIRASLLMVAALSLGCDSEPPLVAPAEPTRLQAEDVPRLVGALPSYTRLGFSGLAFLENRLFASTNIGLLEIHGRSLKHLYRWYEPHNVISGPWNDQSRGALWALRFDDGYFVRLDRHGWHRVDRPQPPRGYSRGDILEGFVGVSDDGKFHLVGAGKVWTWAEVGDWSIHNPLPREPVVGFATVDTLRLYVVRTDVCALPPCRYAAYWYASGRWRTSVRVPTGRVEQVISASQAVFVRGDAGELLRVGIGDVVRVDTPGPCEAITRTSDGRLLASFRGAGIFRLESGWRKVVDDPYPASEGEHWAHLAEHRGVIAFATSSAVQLRSWTGGQEKYFTGTSALWIFEGQELARVNLE